jgi:hypothetical protein
VELAQRAAGERDAVGVVHEAIEDRVAKRRVADQVVPVIDRDLARQQRGTSAGAILNDLENLIIAPTVLLSL